jgi:hypothetical protein
LERVGVDLFEQFVRGEIIDPVLLLVHQVWCDGIYLTVGPHGFPVFQGTVWPCRP